LDLLGLVLRPGAAERFIFNPRPPKEGPALDAALAWQQGRQRELSLWRRQIGYVLQTGGLLPFLTVRQNMELAARLRPRDRNSRAWAGEMGDKLDLNHLWNKMPAQLSVGERQRAAMARALTNRPALILADEPTAALDPAHASMLMELLVSTAAAWEIALLVVTHDHNLLAPYRFRHFAISSSLGKDKITQARLFEVDR
jgi:putative ABC transport system ATP-binding protein